MHRIVVIGLGMAVKPHALALRDLQARVAVAAGYSPSAERRQNFAATWGLPVSGDLDALLADRSIDTALILTPPWAHGELAKRCAASGKHVLLEKPVDVTYRDARALVEQVEATGKHLGVVFQFRFRPGALILRGLIAGKALGELISVSTSIRWWRGPEYYAQPGRGMRARDGGGVLLTQAIHTLDLMLSLAGPVDRVAAQCRTSALRSMDTEDVACAVLNFRNGAVGVVDTTTAAYPGYPERIDFAGTKGTAVLEGERLTIKIRGEPVQIVEGSLAGGSGADPMAFSHEPHRKLIEDFLDAITENREPQVSGRSALPVHSLIDAMLESSQISAPVELSGTERG